MKNRKRLGLVTMAVTILTALVGAGSASATALYNGATKLGVGSTLDFSATSSIKLTNTSGTETLDECTASTMKASISNAGGAGVSVKDSLSELTWTSCSVPTTTTKLGGQEIHWIAGTTIGTVTSSSETSVSINTIFFGVCVYSMSAGTHIGTLTGNLTPSVMDLNEIVVKASGSNFACPETVKILGTYRSTTPESLRVESS